MPICAIGRQYGLLAGGLKPSVLEEISSPLSYRARSPENRKAFRDLFSTAEQRFVYSAPRLSPSAFSSLSAAGFSSSEGRNELGSWRIHYVSLGGAIRACYLCVR